MQYEIINTPAEVKMVEVSPAKQELVLRLGVREAALLDAILSYRNRHQNGEYGDEAWELYKACSTFLREAGQPRPVDTESGYPAIYDRERAVSAALDKIGYRGASLLEGAHDQPKRKFKVGDRVKKVILPYLVVGSPRTGEVGTVREIASDDYSDGTRYHFVTVHFDNGTIMTYADESRFVPA